MKKNVLDHFLAKESVDSSVLKVFYTFGSGQGDVVWNSLYTTGEHYCDSHLIADRYPGLSIGYTDTPSSLISGSGYFTRNDMLRVGSGIGYSDWTVFMDFGNKSCSINNYIPNVSEVLVSSMDSPSSPSGFNLGVNNVNKLFLEYNKLGENITYTLDEELSNFSVVSFSYDNFLKEFGLSYHDFPNGVNKEIAFSAENYIHSDTWHLGGMNNPSALYTGYSGYVDDFLFFNKSINGLSRNNISEAFFVNQVIPAEVTMSSGYMALPASVTINPTGIIGTSITGYDCFPALTVEQKVGDDISLYSLSGMTGYLTGDVVKFEVSGSGWVPVPVFTPEHSEYNTGELMRHSKKFISFSDVPSDEDLYEFYLFQKPKPNLNKSAYFSSSRGVTELSTSYSVGQSINLYLNGVIQVSGSNYQLSNANVLSNFFGIKDHISYDKINAEIYEGDGVEVPFVSGFGGNSSNYDIDIPNLIDEDIYINGQKLISGADYSIAGGITTLYPDLPPGELSFLPRAKEITSIMTGNSNEKIKTESVDELIWLNGVKQVENQDYFRINECTPNDPSKKIKKQSLFVYNNNGEFFNIE